MASTRPKAPSKPASDKLVQDDADIVGGDDVDMPPEIEADDDNVGGADIMGLGFDNERDDADILASKPPTGDWMKEDSWEAEIRCNSEDRMPGDIQPGGRTLVLLKGKPVARVANGQEYEPTLFYRISADKRKKMDDPTKDDSAYKLYLRAKELYVALYSESPTSWKQLITMLKEDSYVVRTMNGDNGALVVDIKAKRQQR